MKIGVPKETYAGEKRVATTPEVISWLQKLGYSVTVEAGAGAEANFSDDAYREAGAEIATDTKALWDSMQTSYSKSELQMIMKSNYCMTGRH